MTSAKTPKAAAGERVEANPVPSALCVAGQGWQPCRFCHEQPEVAPSPFGGVMARCFTVGCRAARKGEDGFVLADEWQRVNRMTNEGCDCWVSRAQDIVKENL
jgi:hypothetical protein